MCSLIGLPVCVGCWVKPRLHGWLIEFGRCLLESSADYMEFTIAECLYEDREYFRLFVTRRLSLYLEHKYGAVKFVNVAHD